VSVPQKLVHELGLKRSRAQGGAVANELLGVSGGFADEQGKVFRGVVQAKL